MTRGGQSAANVSLADFDFVRRLVYDYSAIALDDSKEYLVEARLSPIARREGLSSVSELIRRLRNGETQLRHDVVAAVATNETTFFRDMRPFDALREVIIPQVLTANGGRSLSLWSAAASSGQEAYSLAMVVRDHFPHVPNVTILGTDFAADVLMRARAGRYSQLEVNRGLPARLLVEHFVRDGREWQLSDDIRSMVTFRQLNLALPLVGMPAIDIVFLRNVLIYFDDATRAQVLRRVATVLRPGGYLFLGGSETTYGIDDSFELVQPSPKTVCYRLHQMKAGRS
ncbi:MAG: protein-glutamate O-methyltransferase CheR [Acidimicrobiales bacterium]